MKIQKVKRNKIIFICWFFFLMYWGINSIINNCGIYADGSYSIFEVLNQKGLWLWYPERKLCMALTRLFVVVFLKLNITNFILLVKAYSFGCVIWTILFVLLASYIFFKYNTRMFEINICVWGLILTFTGLYCMHESLLAVAISWLQFAYICFYNKITSRLFKTICLILSCICVLGTHESYAVLAICLVILGIAKWYRNKRKGDCFFYLILFFILVGGIYEVYGGIVGNDSSKMGFLTSLKYVDKLTVIWYIILILYVMLFSVLKYNENVDRMRRKFEVILSFTVVIFMLKNIDIIVHDTRYIRPLLHVIIPGGIMLLTALTIDSVNDNKYYEIAPLISKVVIIAATASVTLIGWGYSNYLKEIWNEIDMKEGFVEWENNNVYNTDWTIPFESLIASKIYSNGKINSIAVQPQNQIYYQPFNMWNIDEYFDLTEFGLSIDKEKFRNINNINFEIKLLDDCRKIINIHDDLTLKIMFKLDSLERFDNLNRLSVSYHIYDENGKLLIWDGNRTSFATYYDGYSLKINIPEIKTFERGNYLIKIDVVQEGVCWLSEKNIEMPSAMITIQ